MGIFRKCKAEAYPLDKARKILEEDGIIVNENELKQIVNSLTLLAQQEAEFLTEEKQSKP